MTHMEAKRFFCQSGGVMENEKRALSRKPLSDCTNIVTTATTSSAALQRNSFSSSKYGTELKPLKPSKFANNRPIGSLKSNFSTGSTYSTINIPSIPVPSNPPALPDSLTDFGGNCEKSGAPVPPNRKHATQTRKDKGKVALGSLITEPSHLSILHSPHFSSSAAPDGSGCQISGSSVAQSQRQAAQNRKDKGKAVLESSIVEPPHLLTLHSSQLPSSAASGGSGCKIYGPPPVQNQRQAMQLSKDKGKAVAGNLSIEPFHLPTSHGRQLPSSLASGGSGCKTPGPPASHSQRRATRKRDDNGKAVSANTIKQSHCSTHCSPQPSSLAGSGTSDNGKLAFLTVHERRRVPESRRHRCEENTLSLSCPPAKRIQDIGDKLDIGRDGQSGLRTDPLPVPKNRPRKKRRHDGSVHALRQDEIEKIRAYYADIDAFELPVELASDSDLD
ncbi:hypothetical protein Nepgr_006897 [Nepenthes gracilis]|uniref:Uncharacterized protein n=1 Tax=Nepenthes gracilis TaxID=150966 RepID=A0AAD3S6N7_NEPGR|nr:hypothetical protein Nepgr_006897 [Nepenthes gracilis]